MCNPRPDFNQGENADNDRLFICYLSIATCGVIKALASTLSSGALLWAQAPAQILQELQCEEELDEHILEKSFSLILFFCLFDRRRMLVPASTMIRHFPKEKERGTQSMSNSWRVQCVDDPLRLLLATRADVVGYLLDHGAAANGNRTMLSRVRKWTIWDNQSLAVRLKFYCPHI